LGLRYLARRRHMSNRNPPTVFPQGQVSLPFGGSVDLLDRADDPASSLKRT
jgi:hypothetical protein